MVEIEPGMPAQQARAPSIAPVPLQRQMNRKVSNSQPLDRSHALLQLLAQAHRAPARSVSCGWWAFSRFQKSIGNMFVRKKVRAPFQRQTFLCRLFFSLRQTFFEPGMKTEEHRRSFKVVKKSFAAPGSTWAGLIFLLPTWYSLNPHEALYLKQTPGLHNQPPLLGPEGHCPLASKQHYIVPRPMPAAPGVPKQSPYPGPTLNFKVKLEL